MKITYDTHRGGNTTYASLDRFDKQRILQKLTQNFYKMLEDAHTDAGKRDILYAEHTDYRKNSAGKNNCLQSFLAGILAQHAQADRDFSVWQLEGIELASQVFEAYYRSSTIEFKKGSINTDVSTMLPMDAHPHFRRKN